MLKQDYTDRLDDMLLPEHDMMQFMPGDTMQPISENDLLQEVNQQMEQTFGAAVDKESPAQVAKRMEQESTHFTAA